MSAMTVSAGSIPLGTRVLVLLNPGQTSRHYMLGIAAAAERAGVLAGTLELGPVWQRLQTAGAQGQAVRSDLGRQVTELCARHRVTHAIGYTQNGVFDFGLYEERRGHAPVSALTRAGVRHILLWTDHPNWAMNGAALDPQVSSVLAHPNHLHVVKSPAAASELRAMNRWANVIASPMAEDYTTLTPAPDLEPRFEAAVLMSDAAPLPGPVRPFLDHDDPDPSAVMESLLPVARKAAKAFVAEAELGASLSAASDALLSAMIEARVQSPLVPVWTLAQRLREHHPEALAWLSADPRRWHRGAACVNALSAWRRFFWPAWLGRRVSLGVFGSPAERLGLPAQDDPKDAGWVAYHDQPRVYAQGRVALNVNAAHDEAGLTHKPFQIAASGVCCVHHATLGLDDCFEPGEEVVVFERGPELLDAVRSLASDERRPAEFAERALERAKREHAWEHRLASFVRAAPAASTEGGALESAA